MKPSLGYCNIRQKLSWPVVVMGIIIVIVHILCALTDIAESDKQIKINYFILFFLLR